MKSLAVIVLAGTFLSTAAMAQTTSQNAAQTTPPTAAAAAQSNTNLRAQMKADMEKAGFTNVTIRPDSFLVQAKDKSGNPVTMMIDPDSVTEIVADDSTGAAGAGQGAQPGASFTKIPRTDAMTSKIIGTEVHNSANQDIGTIKDIAYAGSSIKAYIVGVGGFLGVGDHDVAVTPSALHVSWDANAKAWRATMNTTADQLKAAPEFKYQT